MMNQNTIRIIDIKIKENCIITDIAAEGEVVKAFKGSEFSFTFESNMDMTGVPESIAVIPALGTLIPLAWLFDAKLYVDECDVDFIRCIPKVKKGYMDMYPDVEFRGDLVVGKEVNNRMEDAVNVLTLLYHKI